MRVCVVCCVLCVCVCVSVCLSMWLCGHAAGVVGFRLLWSRCLPVVLVLVLVAEWSCSWYGC